MNDIYDLANMAGIASRYWRARPVSIACWSEGCWPNRPDEHEGIIAYAGGGGGRAWSYEVVIKKTAIAFECNGLPLN